MCRKKKGSISPVFPVKKRTHKTARGMRRKKMGSISPYAMVEMLGAETGLENAPRKNGQHFP